MLKKEENDRFLLDSSILKKIIKKEQKAIQNQKKYGKIKPIIHKKINDINFIAVGEELYYSKKCKTFIDFLFSYIWIALGNDWIKKELKKKLSDEHQIIRWYKGMVTFQKTVKKSEDNLYHTKSPNGSFSAFLLLSYDLYLIKHHLVFQKYVIERLKKRDQFQGARYELFVTASCIRAGFEIDFENEKDRRKKHVEFIATHKKTGQKIAIEAKSKHRKGIMGYSGEKELTNSIRIGNIIKLINTALKKETKYPLVIFIDVNLPPTEAENLLGEEKGILWLANKFSNINKHKNGKDLFNLIIFTNHPHHYGKDYEPDPNKIYSTVTSLNPDIRIDCPVTLNDLLVGVLQYGNIPCYFPNDDDKIL